MIQERYVSFEVAKLLKEKGFDEPCTGLNKLLCEDGKKPVMRITHQKAMVWLREKGVYMYVEPFITISSMGYNLEGYKPWVTTFKGNWFNPLHVLGKIDYTQIYEEAVESALKYALENLIK